MLRIAIIDDEVNVRKVIKKLLDLVYPECLVVGEAASIASAKNMLGQCKPDIVLLDIELEDGTGFGLLDQLPSVDFKLIFITAFDQYAIKAFKYNALDYLLKPIEPEELKITLDRVRNTIYAEKEVKTILENLNNNNNTDVPKIVIRTSNKTYFIEINNILYCKSEGSYTKIITKDQSILASKNLKHYQDLLPEVDFIRTHQSYLVNKVHIIGMRNDSVQLNNNETIVISTRKKAEIRALLTKK